MNDLCRVKKIRGYCTLHVVVKETTKGSKKVRNAHTNLHRRKLKEPLVMMKGTNNEYTEYTVGA